MSPPSSPRRPSMTWKPPPRQPAMRSSSACSKRNRTLLTPHWSSSIASVFPPAVVHSDGAETVTVASRFGTLELAGQVCYHPAMQTHIMPGNRVLPPHHGIIITRGLHLLGLFAAPGAVVCSRGPSARLANARGACAVRYHGPQPRAHPWADHPPGRASVSRRRPPPR